MRSCQRYANRVDRQVHEMRAIPLPCQTRLSAAMISAAIPQFFTSDLHKTLTYFDSQLGFPTQFQYGDPPHYAGAFRDGKSIFFRRLDTVPAWPPGKYVDEMLDIYVIVEGIRELFSEYKGRRVEFHRELAAMPWGFTEFIVKDIDGRLLCFGQFTEDVG